MWVRKVWILLCAFGLVCSCDKEENVPVAVADATAPSFVGQKGVPGTRATDIKWDGDDEIGIYMLKKSGNTFNYALSDAWYKNRKYTVANVTNGKLTPAAGHEMYYPVSGDKVAFVAYYPYQSDADDVDNPNTLTFDFTDQDAQINKEAKDFVFHRGTKGYNKSDPDVELKFNHMFSRIRITVKQGIGGPPSLDDLDVTLTNMPKSAEVDLNKLASDETDLTALKISEEEDDITPLVTYDGTKNEATVEAIVAPHKGTGNFANRKFMFTTADGIEYEHALANDEEFKSGHVYDFELTLNPLAVLIYDGLSNCYMVKPGESKVFPVSRAYTRTRMGFTKKLHVDYLDNPAGEDYTGEFGIDVVWEDPYGLINRTETKVEGDGNAATITVQTNAGNSGNAVVKIFKKDDPQEIPVWSYHIWVTDYDTNDVGATWINPNSTTYKFMNRNLGATDANLETATRALASRGLFYQWGRKDPFPGGKAGTAGYDARKSFEGIPESDTPGPVTVPVNTADATGIAAGILESIQRPTTFFATIPDADWLPAGKGDLWVTSSERYPWELKHIKKTIYDPCPEGWRVPSSYMNHPLNIDDSQNPWYGSVFTNVTTGDRGGATINNTEHYPYTGYRNPTDGAIMSQGLNTFLWISYPVTGTTDSASYCVWIASYGFHISSNQSRSRGMPVRCVEEP
jgi:hypothetical protein